MNKRCLSFILSLCIVLIVIPASGQPFGPPTVGPTFPTDDQVIKNFWKEAIDSSRLQILAHELLDVIGPRLVGSPQMKKANEWAVAKYQEWGIEAKNEEYGKWRGWERGVTHIDLLQPRVRALEGMMLEWSPPTKKGGVTAGLIILADAPDSLAFLKWLPSVKGKFVLASQQQPTGRPDKSWEEFALKESFDSLKALRTRIGEAWQTRLRKTGFRRDTLAIVLENAGAAGILVSDWPGGWGAYRIFGTNNKIAPVLAMGLEDYNLLYRLVEHGDNPVIKVEAESKFLGPVPTLNTIATMRGSEKPDEYVILSAHFDSHDGGSGATDNGTGTLIMMEAMRILRKYYPDPKRTILVGHWGSEEQGLNGSRAFAKDHPDIVEKVQAVFNQDNGTGRVVNMSAMGLINAGGSIARWLSRVPDQITREIKLGLPGIPFGGGSDHAPFIAAGAPAFGLGSNSWDYGSITWHTNRDTYDKLVFDEIKNNVILAACLAYMASEDPQFVPRDRRVMPTDPRTGKPRPWPEPADPERAGGLKK